MVRFLHAADIHLDSPLVGLARYEGAPVEMLRSATRRAFTNLVDRAIEEAVDFVVIAGDLYDGDWRDYMTGLYFCREMGRLAEAGIPVYVLHGNHDAQSEITRQLRLPKNVHQFGARKPQTFVLEDLGVALHGQSFRTAACTDNLVSGYPEAIRGFLNVGVLHTALDGHAEHAPYAPCALEELVARGYDYWALGHVHEHAIRREEPWVVFPGNLQGRHVREQGARGAVLVSADGGRISVERRLVDVVRWYHLYVDASRAGTLADVVELAASSLEPLVRQQADGRAVAARVTIQGRCRAHGELFGFEPRLRAQILGLANQMAGEELWIEKVCVETAPTLNPDELMARSDAVAELQDYLADARSESEFLQSLSAELRDLLNRCPPELVERVPQLAAVRDGKIETLIEEAAPSLLARLATET